MAEPTGASRFAINPAAPVAHQTSTRKREVWTTDEKRKLDRISKLLASHGVRMRLTCANETCPDKLVTFRPAEHETTHGELSCACTDHIFRVTT